MISKKDENKENQSLNKSNPIHTTSEATLDVDTTGDFDLVLN